MSDFFRFPHTAHLAWLGEGMPRDDKLLDDAEVEELLAGEVAVEEKVDGANVGLSTDSRGELRAQNRGRYLDPSASHPQFKRLFTWLAPKRDALTAALHPALILFGEWCYARHSVAYDALPDWFLGFDVYDREAALFWSTARRDALFAELGIVPVPRLARGHFTLDELTGLFGASRVGSGPMEGLIVRRESADQTLARAKLVRPAFTQAIEAHWSRAPIEPNSRADGGY